MLLRFLFLLLFFAACGQPLRAGGGEYDVAHIPPDLLRNANAVKRTEQIYFEILNSGEAVLKKKFAITILNAAGDELASFSEHYDHLHEIKNIEGALYDASGNELKRLKNKQVLDFSGTDDGTLADDQRRKAHHFYYKKWPYTVEYEVEIIYNGTLFFPVWVPRDEELLSVQQSRFTLTAPVYYKLRYKAFQLSSLPAEAAPGNGKKSLIWEIRSLPALSNEYAAPHWFSFNPVLFTAPSEFEMEKYKGNMETWQEFGKFVYELKKGRDKLPEQVRQAVQKIVSGTNDPKEKITRLYEYLQKNTRYISIQLGIGGWQPFDAAFVAGKAYGDCKALTNYMYSLLKEAGIYSVYTLVRAGRRAPPVIADFPAQQFNHVILAVPLQEDTLWLECTSQTLPAGYLGSHTDNRYALMITEEGGRLVRTPSYGVKENLELRRIKATLDDEATLHISAISSYGALQQEEYHDLIHYQPKDKIKETLERHLGFATYEINDFAYTEQKSALPVIEEKLEIIARNYATITGKRLFIVPNIMTRLSQKLPVDSARKLELQFDVAYRDIDSVEILIPGGYLPESVPKDVLLQTEFGSYESRIVLKENRLFYFRKMVRANGRYPASQYPAMAQFFESVYKADRNRVVLVQNQ